MYGKQAYAARTAERRRIAAEARAVWFSYWSILVHTSITARIASEVWTALAAYVQPDSKLGSAMHFGLQAASS